MNSSTIRVAVLDDYPGVALQMADWSPLAGRAEITIFRDHLSALDALAQRLEPFEVICAMRERTPLPAPLLEHLPRLKLIVSTGRRNASIDLNAAKQRGIVVCGTGYVSHPTPELTWGLIIAAMRHIPAEYASVRSEGWQTSVGRDLKSRTIGIVGLGRIGSTVARYARAFEMNVLAWSQNLTEERAREHHAALVSKEQLFRESDIVSLHLVLSERTRGIVTARELSVMKPSAFLINTARGPLVEESALIDVLRRKAIAGAALDVFDTEPLASDHPFRSLDNVLTTPHIGYVTHDTYEIFYRDTVECIVAWLDGKPVRVMT
jgi:phosphoglycerate dehydrogenase-like enzyme